LLAGRALPHGLDGGGWRAMNRQTADDEPWRMKIRRSRQAQAHTPGTKHGRRAHTRKGQTHTHTHTHTRMSPPLPTASRRLRVAAPRNMFRLTNPADLPFWSPSEEAPWYGVHATLFLDICFIRAKQNSSITALPSEHTQVRPCLHAFYQAPGNENTKTDPARALRTKSTFYLRAVHPHSHTERRTCRCASTRDHQLTNAVVWTLRPGDPAGGQVEIRAGWVCAVSVAPASHARVFLSDAESQLLLRLLIQPR
jgi:hypothetical protein